MSDLFKKVKGIFIVESEAKAKVREDSAKTKTSSNTDAAEHVQLKGGGEVSRQFMDVFFKAMERANLDGFDYLEFKEALNNLETMQMTEATRYKSAFAMAKTMGINTEKLVESAGHYLEVLKKEEEKFGLALNNQKHALISDKEKDVEDLQKLIQEKRAEIKKMEADIAKHEKSMAQKNNEIKGNKDKILQTQTEFQVTYKAMFNQISGDIELINKYLK